MRRTKPLRAQPRLRPHPTQHRSLDLKARGEELPLDGNVPRAPSPIPNSSVLPRQQGGGEVLDAEHYLSGGKATHERSSSDNGQARQTFSISDSTNGQSSPIPPVVAKIDVSFSA